jgi:hypothetical protein
MKSSGVSFMPPFLPFVNGVLIANVMTTSSGFFVVLLGETQSVLRLEEVWKKAAYIAATPVFPPVKCDTIDPSLCVAILRLRKGCSLAEWDEARDNAKGFNEEMSGCFV